MNKIEITVINDVFDYNTEGSLQLKQASFIVYLIAHRVYAIASSDVMESDNFGQN